MTKPVPRFPPGVGEKHRFPIRHVAIGEALRHAGRVGAAALPHGPPLREHAGRSALACGSPISKLPQRRTVRKGRVLGDG